jgi:mediator of RNA polymerase II transcription subunit 7
MAEQQGNRAVAPFPSPPPFFKYFTTQNLQRLQELQASSEALPGDVKDEDIKMEDSEPSEASKLPKVLPEELRYLVPPAPPTSGSYRVFGDAWPVRSLLRNPK